MAQEDQREVFSKLILSEDDLQWAIEFEAWCDCEEESNASASPNTDVDTDTDSDLGFYSSQTNRSTLLWDVNKNEDDPDFDSLRSQPPRSYNDIVEEVLAQFTGLEGEDDTDGFSFAPSWIRRTRQIEAAPVKHHDTREVDEERIAKDGDPTIAIDPERPKYYHIAHEILTSERTYVQGLRILEKVVHGAVKTMHKTGQSVLSEGEMADIFINIGEIYALNLDFLRELEEQFKCWDSNTTVADILAKRGPFFKLYSVYSNGYAKARETYHRKLHSSKSFRKLIKDIEDSPVCGTRDVSSLMIHPIQRIPRYRLLLEDYLKHLPEGHPDIKNSKAALAAIAETATFMNSKITELESQALVLKVQQHFVGRAVLIAPGRKYIGRGAVTFAPTGKNEQRIFIPYILLMASSTALRKYKICHEFELKDLMVKALEPSKNGFCVAKKGTDKVFRFYTQSKKECELWIRMLNIGREANSNHFTVNKMSKYATVLHDPETYKSILSVLSNPSFENSQPSWVRRSQHVHHIEDVDQPEKEGVKEKIEEIKTEFDGEDTEERALLTMVSFYQSLNPGIDNSLSSYMNQKSASGDVWKRRWFVLVNQILICYENHLYDEALGAIPLDGYKLSPLTEADTVKRSNVLKLTHSKQRTYLFELPSRYDFEKWCAILREILELTAST